MSSTHQPTRTCIATRAKGTPQELLRVVARRDSRQGEAKVLILPDPQRYLPGRGAWITPTLSAWETAQQRRAFGRALKVSAATVDAEPVREYIARVPQ